MRKYVMCLSSPCLESLAIQAVNTIIAACLRYKR